MQFIEIKYSASEAAKAVNQLLQFSEQDQESMLEVISDFFNPSCRDTEQQLDDLDEDFKILGSQGLQREVYCILNK